MGYQYIMSICSCYSPSCLFHSDTQIQQGVETLENFQTLKPGFLEIQKKLVLI